MSHLITPPIKVRFTDEALQTASHLKMVILREGGKNEFSIIGMSDEPLSGSGKMIATLKMPGCRTGRDCFCMSLLDPV